MQGGTDMQCRARKKMQEGDSGLNYLGIHAQLRQFEPDIDAVHKGIRTNISI